MTTYALKSGFQNLLRPISNALLGAGVTPNQVTVATMGASIAMAVVVAVFHAQGWPYLALPLFFFVRMALNAIDGLMAKEGNLMTPLGAFLNELGDVVSDGALFLAFLFDPRVPAPLLLAFVFGAFLTELAGVTAVQVGARRRYDGPMGKSDRVILIGALAILLGFGVADSRVPAAFLGLGLLGTVLTVLNRVRGALGERR
ncbi:MAG TPA: CDP-alcohol phosphatidyltransferase family protein [Bdellovibrionota bacterium]|nr:CDP-alcohol phosphatidyltransferase family protein [Bdellovibrionota bacterium]